MSGRRRRPAATDPRMRSWTTREGKWSPPTGRPGPGHPSFHPRGGRVGRALIRDPTARPIPQLRRWAEEARAPWRQGGPAMLETRELFVPTRHGPVRVRIHRPAHGEPARPRLPARRRLDALQHRHPRPRDARVRGSRRLLRRRRRLRAVARAQVSGALEQVVDVVAGSRSRAARSASTPRRLAIGGDSAGANLSVATASCADHGAGPPLCGMLLNYGAFDYAALRGSLPALRRPGVHARLRGNERVLAQLPARRRRCAESARLPAARIARAACRPHSSRSRSATSLPSRASRWHAGCGPPACRHRASSIAGASHSFLEAMSIAAVSNQALEDASEWLGRSSGPVGAAARPWPERDGLRPCRECAGCGGV